MENDVCQLLDYVFLMRNKNEWKKKLSMQDDLIEKRIAIFCGSTFGIVQEFMEIFLLSAGIRPLFHIGEYDRVYEEACFPHADLLDFKPDIAFIHMTNQNLGGGFSGTDRASLEEEKDRLRQIWDSIREKFGCVIIQNNFEYYPYRMIGNAARLQENGNVRYINELNAFIDDYALHNDGFYINDIHYLSAVMGLETWRDDRMWDLYKYPIRMDALPSYACSICGLIRALAGKSKKMVITDLDHTLWDGIIGEVGVENIKVGKETPQGEKHERLQHYLKYLGQQGILLGVCSKNEHEVAIEGIRSQKSILKEDDFVSMRINWIAKPQNIAEMVRETNLLQDAVVFVDDNMVECDSVKRMLPGVETICMQDIETALSRMDRLSFFETTSQTEEDRKRNEYYRANQKREKERSQFSNYDEYLRSLEMQCFVDDINERNMERVVQLFNKTNQFNFMTHRYSIHDVERIRKDAFCHCFVLELDDKFGTNGIVSIGVMRLSGEDAYIEDWIMSCRVFERGLEYVMLSLMCETCIKTEVKRLHGFYRETKKNKKIADFFSNINFAEKGYSEKEQAKEWICEDIQGLERLCDNAPINVMRRSKENG